jgi:hypothetical protein
MPQTAQIGLEYLMTAHADLDPPHLIDAGSRIVNVREGWVEGPNIKARIIAPGADWLQPLVSGVTRIDVRLTMRTDDEQLIYMSYKASSPIPSRAPPRSQPANSSRPPMAPTSWPLRLSGPARKNTPG